MTERTVRLHVFCSVKGGVGKTSLAIVAAKSLAVLGRVVALVDGDLSGTSLADALRLCAPHVELDEEGAVDRQAPPTGMWYSVEKSREQRRERHTAMQTGGKFWHVRPHTPPYFNDALNFAYAANKSGWPMEDQAPRMDALYWRHADEDGILYFPSSSVYADVKESMGWFLDKPYDFAYSLLVSLEALVQQVPALTDIVIDLPPGIWGFPNEALFVVHCIVKGLPFPSTFPAWHRGPVQWRAQPFLVMSQDPNDFTPSLEFVALHNEKLPNLKPIVNRTSEPIDTLHREANERLGPLLAHSGVAERIVRVGHIPAISRLFWKGDLDTKDIPVELENALRWNEVSA